MFGLFRTKSKVEKLQVEYQRLLQEAFHLSHSNRMKSEEKLAQAENLLKEIELLQRNK